MAFNPFITFQKNRRFWMAAILMICMISFVFCTGLKGDMAERFQWMLGSRGDPAFRLDGRTYTTPQVRELQMQRKFANKLMMNCADMAFKKLQTEFFELGKKKDGGNAKENEAREQRLGQIIAIRESIGSRKSRKQYFEIGTKFDDLVEFVLWQNIADKLGIHLEEEHVEHLYLMEFFYQLDRQELGRAEQITLRDFRDFGPTFVRRAITEEFRVRIAQEAYMTAQPFPFFGRKRQAEGLGLKFTTPDVPDEIRAPMTLTQLWDAYKKNRSEFDVTLLPVEVAKYLDNIKKDPTESDKEIFFLANREKPIDPASDARGLVLPQKVKVEFVYADPTSPAYLDSAKLVDALKVTSPFAPDATISPLSALSRYWAANEVHMSQLQAQYDSLGRNEQASYMTAPFSVRDAVAPILARFAKRHPHAVASVLGNAFADQDGFVAVTGYLAWGALGDPNADKRSPEENRKIREEEIDKVVRAELKRRVPVHMTVFAASTSLFPLDMIGPFAAMDLRKTGFPQVPYFTFPPNLPVEAVQKELEDMIARHAAEEKAQQNMQIVRAALEKADSDAEKFKRELSRLVPEYNLTYGPPVEKKDVYFSRHTLDQAKELEFLREAFLKDLHMINLFEGRDLTPERMLKPTDFYKLFYESAEGFSATSNHRAMPWPPRVKPNNARMWKAADPRLINRDKLDPRAAAVFDEHLKQQNPLAPAPVFDDLFKNASKPILFWRTGKRDAAPLPAKYEDLAAAMKKHDEEWKENEKHLKQFAELNPKIDKLRKEEAKLRKNQVDAKELKRVQDELEKLQGDLRKLEEDVGGKATYLVNKQAAIKEDEADLREVQRLVVEGWKFERARSNEALPAARKVADDLIKVGNQPGPGFPSQYLDARITVPRLCRMYPEVMHDQSIDYGKPPLPKDKIPFAREDMIDELISLYELSEPIKIKNSELDDINKELFDRVRKEENPRDRFVQILTNRPRSVFYVAYVSKVPEARKEDFVRSLRGAPYPFDDFAMNPFRHRDHFVERVQQRFGNDFRRGIVGIDALKTSMGFEVLNDKLQKDIDGAVGTD